MYRNIMVALDGSESSMRVLDEAIHAGQYADARVCAVFVADSAALSSYPASYRAEVFCDARTMLDGAQERLRAAGLQSETRLLETRNITDTVARCLQRCVTSLSADLVVMGTHGRSGVRRLVLGSVAEAFLRHSTRPVLLIRSLAQT